MKFQSAPLELIFWLIALIFLWWMNPFASQFSLCPLDNLGLTWCPGCGLGRSISLLMRGEYMSSWSMHPLGGFALAVMLYRIIEIIKLRTITIHNYGKRTKTPS